MQTHCVSCGVSPTHRFIFVRREMLSRRNLLAECRLGHQNVVKTLTTLSAERARVRHAVPGRKEYPLVYVRISGMNENNSRAKVESVTSE